MESADMASNCSGSMVTLVAMLVTVACVLYLWRKYEDSERKDPSSNQKIGGFTTEVVVRTAVTALAAWALVPLSRWITTQSWLVEQSKLDSYLRQGLTRGEAIGRLQQAHEAASQASAIGSVAKAMMGQPLAAAAPLASVALGAQPAVQFGPMNIGL
jgi:hypothetical protein